MSREIDLIPVIVFSFLALALVGLCFVSDGPKVSGEERDLEPISFSSSEELETFLNMDSGLLSYRYPFGLRKAGAGSLNMDLAAAAETSGAPAVGGGGVDHSSTNIQVEGVGEADIIKNDGRYIYAVSGDEVFIVGAYPPGNMRSITSVHVGGSVNGIYEYGDRLIVLGSIRNSSQKRAPPESYVKIFDISDVTNPSSVGEFSVDGRYFDSRRIDNYVYLLSTESTGRENVRFPRITKNGETETLSAGEIRHFGTVCPHYRFMNVLSIDVNKGELDDYKSYLTGYNRNIYVSMNSIYVTGGSSFKEDYWIAAVRDGIVPNLPNYVGDEIVKILNSGLEVFEKRIKVSDILSDYFSKIEEYEKVEIIRSFRSSLEEIPNVWGNRKTSIRRISIENGKIEYSAVGEVPGEVLNQFSMSEHEGYFRIATTTGSVSRVDDKVSAKNNVYILDRNLDVVGKVEDLAPNERIYSARFMGDKCYLVTFRKVDPLFVLDLGNPSDPEVLGKLKIPGYSDYLHPYDENYLIGVGKSTVAAEEGDFAWYQGVKVALFDVRNVNEPKEISNFVIGDRGTESRALRNHHAFMFSRSKNLLSIPITLAEIDENKYSGEIPSNQRGETTWQGSYVLGVSPENGIALRGRITHITDNSVFRKSGYFFNSSKSIKRSLYIGNAFYTYSEKLIKANRLSDLKSISKVPLIE